MEHGFQSIQNQNDDFLEWKIEVRAQHSLKNVKIQQVREHKHFGILLFADMKWTAHIDYIVRKAMKKLGLLHRRSRKFRIKQKIYIIIRNNYQTSNWIWLRIFCLIFTVFFVFISERWCQNNFKSKIYLFCIRFNRSCWKFGPNCLGSFWACFIIIIIINLTSMFFQQLSRAWTVAFQQHKVDNPLLAT